MPHLSHIIARTLGACALLAGLGWGAPAQAVEVPTLVVRTSAECAGEQGRQQLIRALKARLGAETSYVDRAEAQTPHWVLQWSKGAQESCALVLSDTGPVMSLPLVANADSTQMQEVLVRIVWMVSTQPPRTPEPVAVAPVAPVTPEPVTPEPVAPQPADPSAPPVPEPAGPEPVDPKEPVTLTQPAGEGLPGADVEEVDPQGAELMDLSSFERFQAGFPGLFGYAELNETNALELNWSDKPTLFSPHVGWTYRAGVSLSQPVFSNLLQVGVIIDRSFNIGLSYQHVDRQDAGSTDIFFAGGSNKAIEMHAGRVDAEYLFMPGSDVHLALNLSLGAGRLKWTEDLGTFEDPSDEPRFIQDALTLVLVDIGARFYYDATDWLQVGFGFTWQTGFHWAFDDNGPGNISGPSGDMTLRVGFF